MTVLRDAANFTSGFIAEGLGAFFGGLILTGMDGEAHRRACAAATGVHAGRGQPLARRRWSPSCAMSTSVRWPPPGADLMDFGLHFPIRLIYSLMGFPDDRPEQIEQYAAWALAILAGPQVDAERAALARKAAMEAAQALYDAVKVEVVQVRKAGAQGEDLISRLIRAEYEGRRLDDHEVTTFVRSLLPAAGKPPRARSVR
jgi:cytochrome P450